MIHAVEHALGMWLGGLVGAFIGLTLVHRRINRRRWRFESP